MPNLPVNICFSWPAVSVGVCSYARAPGRPTRESSIFSFLYPAEESVSREEGGGQTEPSCWLVHSPKFPFVFSPFGFLLFHLHLSYSKKKSYFSVHTIAHVHTLTSSISPFFSVSFVSLTGEQRPSVPDGGDLPFRLSCHPRDTRQANCV